MATVILETQQDTTTTDESSLPFVGRWHTLISTTNWEKGRIICEWRRAKQAAGEEVSEYSDEAWAQLVGEVTSQHVGRLRRVFERFGDVYQEYEGLYWSHFHAGLDWDDAEVWLEGALQQGWSVARMRRQRDEAHGKAADADEAHVMHTRISSDELSGDGQLATVVDPESGEVASATGSDRASEKASDRASQRPQGSEDLDLEDASARAAERTSPKLRPFETLAELPDDLADAFEAMKLAILHHKLSGWDQVARDDVLASLDALRQLALAPSE